MTKKLADCTPEEAEKLRARAKAYKLKNRERLKVQAAERHAYRYANEPDYKARKDRQSMESLYRKRYGMERSDREAMLQAQGGVCAICGTDSPGKTRSGKEGNWHTDHCHTGGQVRAILCAGCNTFLGRIESSKVPLQKFLDYLETHRG